MMGPLLETRVMENFFPLPSSSLTCLPGTTEIPSGHASASQHCWSHFLLLSSAFLGIIAFSLFLETLWMEMQALEHHRVCKFENTM
jgi:hypothetical protein